MSSSALDERPDDRLYSLRDGNKLLLILANKLGGLEFKRIEGHAYWFAVSDGSIWSLRTWNGESVRKMRPFTTTGGYLCIKEGRRLGRRCCKVHHLICAAFNGPKPEWAECCRHLDGDVTNNKPENLAWGTLKENVADTKTHGRWIYGEANFQAKLTDEIVAACKCFHELGMPISIMAAYTRASVAAIHKVVKGKSWVHVKKSVS